MLHAEDVKSCRAWALAVISGSFSQVIHRAQSSFSKSYPNVQLRLAGIRTAEGRILL